MSTATAPAPASTSTPLPVGRLVGVGAVVFFANAALLVLQLVAGRLLAPFVGSSLETWTSIIGVFLAGIALGNGLGGKLADRYPTPRTLAALLALGAVAALWMLLFPLLLSGTGAHKLIPLGARIPILATLLCLPAGFVLSLLTPLAIKLGLPDVAHTGRVAGLIFALSTLGCLIGNYFTGFYLIPHFTINTLVLVAVGVLLALAGATFLMQKPGEGAQTSPPNPLSQGERGDQTPPSLIGKGDGGLGSSNANPHAFPDIRRAYLIVFLASFCGMTLELTASRMLAQPLGVSLFTWTGIIGVMLAGTALGNFTGGQIADRVNRSGTRRDPRLVLAGTLCSAGAAVLLVLIGYALLSRSTVYNGYGAITQVLLWTFSLFFLPMFMLGLVSPQVIRLSVPDVAHAGRVAGRVYAWSTVGAIVGTFAAGYLLLSTLGMRNTILVAGLVLAGTSLLVAKVWDNNPLLYLFSIVLGGVTGGFILTFRAQLDEGVVAVVESNYYTIKVSQGTTGRGEVRLTLSLDRLTHSVVDPYNPRYLYYEHEYIQMEFLHAARGDTPEPKVLVIGGGGYTFPRCAKVEMPECVMDVVEIDPKVTQVAYDHLGLRHEYGINHFHMDGRQFVAERVKPGTYDLVVQDAVNDFSVPAHLMTKEYNDAVKATLKPNGVYLLTIIDSLEHGKLWKAAMATLGKTFPPENVILLTPDAIPDADTEDGDKWNKIRKVLVIYASDQPFDSHAFQSAVAVPKSPRLAAGLAAAVVGSVDPPGSGPALAVRPVLGGFRPPIYTIPIPPSRLKPFTDREPGVVLTDQFAPIDNLMAEVFRYMYRERE